MSESAKAKGELQKTKAELTEDEKMLVEVTATFNTKKSMYETNQKTRADEIAAITKAIDLISSPAVSGASFTQVSLLQTQSTSRRVVARQRVSRFLEQKAQLLSSKTLQSFASVVSGSPFAKVVDLIKDLIAKLKEEAASEAEHNEWCKKQLKANKLTRGKQGSKAEKLDAQIEGLKSDIDSKADAIATISAELASLSAAMTKATDIRTEEKKQNTGTIKDAEAGAEATGQALIVLRKFYNSQSFIQQAPDMEKYSGQQGSSKSVIGMLEVIESDFLKLKAETAADEGQAAKEYDKFMSEAKKNKGEKEDKRKKLSKDKDKATLEKSEASKDYKLTKEKLQAANKYFAYLKPTCVEIHVSFGERAQKRKEEIKALKEAYGILDSKGD
jgi:hypothetical protein